MRKQKNLASVSFEVGIEVGLIIISCGKDMVKGDTDK